MEKLTEREQQAYDFIVNYFKDNGFSPSYQEIAEGIYYGSATSVTPIIQKLKDKGYIELPYKATARAIKVVGMEHTIGQASSIPESVTNGDMIKAMFDCQEDENQWYDGSIWVTFRAKNNPSYNFDLEWWNAPYKRGSEK